MEKTQLNLQVLTRKWEDSIASENKKVLAEHRTYAHSWRSNAIKLEDARYGRQFSAAEEKELLAFRQAPLPISISTAICDTADAMTLSGKPTVHVSPIIVPRNQQATDLSKEVALKFRHLIQKAWFDSLGNLQFDRAVNDVSNVGHGILYAIPRSEFGEFKVDVKHLSWRYFFPDPSCQNIFYEDADNHVYAMPITKKAAFRFVKSIEPDMTLELFDEHFTEDGEAEKVFEEDPVLHRRMKPGEDTLFVQRLSLEEETSYLIIPKAGTVSPEDGYEYRHALKITDQMKKDRAEGKIKIEKVTKVYLVEYTSIGNYGYKVVYPISSYNLIPLTFDHRDSPFPYSRMWFLYPLQRALNKFITSSILSMSLMNSLRVMAEEGSIINMKDWTTHSSVPGVILRYRLPTPGFSEKPEVIEPRPLNEAHLILPRYITSMMEYVSGIYGTMMGNPEGSPDVFSTVASLQSAGGLKIKRRLGHVDAQLSKLGRVMGEFYKEFAPLNGYSSSFNSEKNEEEVVEYNIIELEEVGTDKDGVPKFQASVDPGTDLRKGFKTVRFTTQGSSGYEAATEAAMLTNLATQLKQPALIPLILERVGIEGVGDLAKNMDSMKQLEGQNQQLQEVVQQLEGKNKTLENQIFTLVRTLEGAKAKGKFDVELEKFKKDPMGYLEQAANMQGER